jgi:uncharacterized protein (DUF58 family)
MATQSWRDFFDESFLRRLERLRLAAKSALARSRPGARRARLLGDGLEFADHRAYVPGDDLRFLDWAYYARMERLLFRLFHEHSEADVAILLDCSASLAPGGRLEKFHAARRAAAVLAYVAMSGGERVRLVPFAEELGTPLRTGRDRAGFVRVLEWLAALRPAGRTRLRDCADRFARQDVGSATVLLLSDLLDCRADLPVALAHLRLAGCSVCVIHLYSPDDASPDLSGPLLLEHAEWLPQRDEPASASRSRLGAPTPAGRPARHLAPRRIAVQAGPEVLQSYRLRWREFADSCRRTCLAQGALYVPAPTDAPLDKGLLRALREAGALQG